MDTLFSLKRKIVILTGATGYLGQYFAKYLLEAGAKVVLLGRGEKIVKMTASLRKKYGKAKVDGVQVDLYREEDYAAALHEVARKNRVIDVLVNNAYEFSKETGFNDSSGRMDKISKAQWMRSLEAGVYWAALSSQIIGEKMKGQGHGSIINISSMYSLVAPDPKLYEGVSAFNPPSYGPSKAALNALTRYTASFYGAYAVRCNAIIAGSFPNTDRSAYNSPKSTDFMKRLEAKTVLNRVGAPDDLKGALIFLASEASNYMTGQNVVVDGGWTIR